MSREVLAITNYRVSSDEQLKNNSIDKQERKCLETVQMLNAKHHKAWSGSVSSKKGLNVERKDLQEMLDECKNNKNIKYAVFDELDRFMRSMLEIGYFLIEFKKLGVRVVFASQPDLNADTATNTLLLMLEAYKAEGSNEERQRKSINGHLNALKEGRYTFVPKPGYVRGRTKGIPDLHAIKGPSLRKVLLDIVYRRVTPSQGLINLNNSEFMSDGHSLYKMDKFRKIATDPFYAGIVEIRKQVNVRNENGLHEALITIEEHEELINIFDSKKKNQSGPRKNGNPKFPVSNMVSCDSCRDKTNGRYVGFNHGNGKNPNLVYEKYRCRGCARYLTKQYVHQGVEQQFKDNPVTFETAQDVIEAINIVWKQEEGESEREVVRTKQKIKVISETIQRQVEDISNPSLIKIREDILSSISKNKEEVVRLEKQLKDIQSSVDDDKEEFLQFAYDFIINIGDHFLDTELVSKENRLRCKQVVFPAGFYVDSNNKVYTPEISELYRLATNKFGAGEETLTLDLILGKDAL